MTSTPKHTDTTDLVMNGYDTVVLLDTLRAFNPKHNIVSLEKYKFTLEDAWAVIAKVALAAIDDGLRVTLTRDELAALHCVVAGTDVKRDEDYMRVESDLCNQKWLGGYRPRYEEPLVSPEEAMVNYLESMTLEELEDQSEEELFKTAKDLGLL